MSYTVRQCTIHCFTGTKTFTQADMLKDNFFTQTWFEPKIFYPRKCINYDKSNLQQDSVKGQKDPNSDKKNSKSNIKFQNVPENATKKRKISTLLIFSTKQRKIFQRFYLKLDFFYNNIVGTLVRFYISAHMLYCLDQFCIPRLHLMLGFISLLDDSLMTH